MSNREEKVKETAKKWAEGEIEPEELLKYEDGKLLMFQGMDVVPLPARAFGELIKGVVEEYGPTFLQPLRKAYANAGRRDGKDVQGAMPEERLGMLYAAWGASGWTGGEGTIEVGTREEMREVELGNMIGEIQEDDTRVRIEFDNTFSSRAVLEADLETDFPVCLFEPYYIAGSLEVWLDRKIETEETHCRAMGDDTCVYVFHLGDPK